jgi:S-adenosyl-L-methionine hydrolase (adenosine-forming)
MTGGAGRTVSLTNAEYHLEAPGATFAGRDIFAPVAAHLCAGVPLEAFGDLIDPITMLPGTIPIPRDEPDGLAVEVLWVDRFGNAQLNVGPEDVAALGGRNSLRWGDQVRTVRTVGAYGELKPGELGLVVDSYGLLSLALDRSSAADQLKLRPGTGVTMKEPE